MPGGPFPTFDFMQHAISKEGFETLKAEWEDLKYNQRPAMSKQVSDAAAEGDRSENAAYTYGKMRMREIDRRLRYLDRLLDGAQIVEQTRHAQGEIVFGAQVLLRAAKTGAEKRYTFVGEAEINPLEGRISLKSPVGKALLGRSQGESVEVETPRGKIQYLIAEVRYV